MDIFEGLRYCLNRPFKRICIDGEENETLFYDSNKGKFIYEDLKRKTQALFILNNWRYDCIWRPVIEKVPLDDLLNRWLEDETIYCEIDGEEWNTTDGLTLTREGKEYHIKYITSSSAKQPIWYTKD